MFEWFSDLPIVIQVFLAMLTGSVLLLIFLGGAWILSRLRGNVVGVSDSPVTPTGTYVEDSGNVDEDDFELEVGVAYDLTESPYPAQIRVGDEVEDDEIFGDLIIGLPPGAKFVSLQRVYSEDYEEFLLDHFVIVYLLNGDYITQTWEGDLYFSDYEVYPNEIIVRESK
ncbi:hypothetical protein A2962_03680 [Candidatus Woesebacteria bacterium RIFCSPLOWO2_01_FULL_39_61]|uniref:Uncharacterized protein n=1 Tax=Candidatus Woesebacteria bacterium RIFCSPHIGHO2_02_FULL_39_13 TaxID=1802505 RepID=A0A1F7Z2I6_9BACT|nr:MAG: hypothetical protein A2692_03860 [Candidatus Woesebacteria bacterium RIFCSPHIGHO2_01_FULL_39_95]OGM33792.1 MAG: hypothetical protein A3D01_02370 [Candidatus Woesebacteria bacterium RIFCSPHIGHO2_02_FULL_39_13]OGM38953.1 MAG: hypothetical protein A3E13_04640 [Candidatus Woesebacteria bacterium RIFCSPHIGHO2_12_FULL_40_20]OGM65601.1 MAG: hypothetical protein A2962_03680 [Candidatus Woesebacteria bacterium RIFCSPLOWO2_01_FULL_39_61]OGM72535.1 MAG: hypothetical protein A3H19_01160 [Candidatus